MIQEVKKGYNKHILKFHPSNIVVYLLIRMCHLPHSQYMQTIFHAQPWQKVPLVYFLKIIKVRKIVKPMQSFHPASFNFVVSKRPCSIVGKWIAVEIGLIYLLVCNFEI